jgi:biotin carboxyl carrier protein
VRYDVEIAGRLRRLEVTREGGRFAVAVDGRNWLVDAARVDAYTLSLLVVDVWPKGDTDPAGSYDVIVASDRAAGRLAVRVGAVTVAATVNGHRRRGGHVDRRRDGPEHVLAPMPGKIVRLLVKPGELVRARQPLVVVEAMKMENEIRAVGDGTVARIHVEEGASVDAGAPLIVIE